MGRRLWIKFGILANLTERLVTIWLTFLATVNLSSLIFVRFQMRLDKMKI